MAALADNAAVASSPVEVFYSYSHKDEDLRDEIEKHLSILRRQGVIAGWHDRKITGGAEWAGEIDEHLNSAQIVLLLISSDFLASDYCYDLEMSRALERHGAGEARVVPVILRPVDWSGAPFGKLQALPKDGKPITSWSNRDEGFKDVAIGIRKVVEELCAGAAVPRMVKPGTKSSGLPRICNLPHLRNPNFTGRDDLLKQLHDSLTSGKAAALTQAMHGLGGVGKTQTAVEYIYRHAGEYDIAWWIRSEEPAKLASEYAALAEPLGLRERSAQDQGIIVQAVRGALAGRGRWLVVFDNATGPEEIRDFLPPGGTGHVLVTSRDPAFGGVAHPLKVEKMSPDEAVEFLLKRTQQGDQAAAASLARELGYLPLALEHAGAYVEETGTNFSGYLKTFGTQQKALLARAKRPPGYNATVATTWELSFAEVEKKSEAAAQLMNLCAFLAPDDIGREMLRSGAKHLPEPLAKAVGDDLQWDDAVGALRRYSLVEVQDSAISVHRLVQAVVRDRLDDAGRKKWAGAAVGMVNAAFPYKIHDVGTWAASSRLLPHALASAEHAEGWQVGREACGRLLNQVGLYLRRRAELSAAKTVLERALKIGEAVYGPDHPEVATFANNLGLVLKEQGDLAGARACYERAMRIDEVVYGPDHTEVATDVNNLGVVLRQQGDLAGARAYLERALKIDEAVYGPDHPKVATYVNNLGDVLAGQGDLAGARAHFERALKIDEAAYGPDHPEVAIDVNNLGNVLAGQGDLAGARAHFERALKIDEAAYGPDHPKVATRVSNLGNVLQDQGDLAGARACYERALKIDEAAYGPDHPEVATDVNNLGVVLKAQGDLAEARAYLERALKIVERSLGRDHLKTQTVRRNLESLGR